MIIQRKVRRIGVVAAAAGLALTVSACSKSDAKTTATSAPKSTTAAASATSTAASGTATETATTGGDIATSSASDIATSSGSQSSASGGSDTGLGDIPDGKGVTITFMQGVKGDGFYISMQCGAQEVADAAGATLTVQGPDQFDATLQNPMLDAVAASKPDALLVAPNDVEASTGPLLQIQKAGTKVVLVDTQVNDKSVGVSRIASNNEEGGAAAADALADLIGEEGDVLVINTKPGISTTDQRQKGFEDAIKKYPNIKYDGTQFSQNDAAKAAEIVTAALQANPNLKGIFATNLFSAQGAATGLSQAGKSGDVKIVGFDAGSAQVEQLKAGDVQALVVQKPYEIGQLGVKAALQAVAGETPEAEIQTGFVIATADNLSDPEIDKYLYKEKCG